MGTTTGIGLLGDKCLDPQLDAYNIAQDRRLLTSVVILPSDFGGDLWELATRMVETSSRGGINPQVDRLTYSKAYTAGQQLW